MLPRSKKIEKQRLQHATKLVVFKDFLFRHLRFRTMGTLVLPTRRQGMRYALRLQCFARYKLTLKATKIGKHAWAQTIDKIAHKQKHQCQQVTVFVSTQEAL